MEYSKCNRTLNKDNIEPDRTFKEPVSLSFQALVLKTGP